MGKYTLPILPNVPIRSEIAFVLRHVRGNVSVFCKVSQKEISVNLQTKITGYLRYPYKSIHYLSYSVYLSEAQSPLFSGT